MPIALTVLVAPSRRQRLLVAGAGACLCLAAAAVACSTTLRFTAEAVVAGALLFAGVCLVHAASRAAMVHRIDISGPGQIRLTVQQDLRPDATGGEPVMLLPGSTLWPRLMLLRFGPLDAGGAAGGIRRVGGRAVRCVVVFPDSVAPDAFRALAVALGAAAGPGAVSATEIEIL